MLYIIQKQQKKKIIIKNINISIIIKFDIFFYKTYAFALKVKVNICNMVCDFILKMYIFFYFLVEGLIKFFEIYVNNIEKIFLVYWCNSE